MILRSSCCLILCRNREASPSAGDDSPFRAFEAAILDALRSSASPSSASPSSASPSSASPSPASPSSASPSPASPSPASPSIASHCGAVPVAAIMPHLYDLKDDGPALEYMRGLREPLVVLSWLPARACYWRLRAAGLSGFLASVEEDAATLTPATSNVASGSGSRAVWCLDLHDYARPEDCAEAVRRVLAEIGRAGVTGDSKGGTEGGTEGGAKGESGTEVQEIAEPTSSRWYPVIDRDRCVNCLECLNFCLFGVYGLDEAETIRVEQPDACRPGCPACARVCPSGAILFPEHGDPTISGRSVKEAERAASGATMLLPMFDPLARAHAERDAAGSAEPGASKSSHSPGEEIPPAKNARLDELVDDVDRFDLS